MICPRCGKLAFLTDVKYSKSSKGIIGVPYLRKEYACPNCGWKPTKVKLAPKPGTPIVSNLFSKDKIERLKERLKSSNQKVTE